MQWKNPTKKAFALPTILLASTLLMMVLVVAAASATSITTSLNNQYYKQMAQEAAESGVARAVDCIKSNGFIVGWTSKPLKPNTNCNGTPQGSACPTSSDDYPLGTDPSNCFVLKNDSFATTFSVLPPSQPNLLSISAVTMKLRDNGSVAKTYVVNLKSRISSAVGVSRVTFGYSIAGGAFFATITEDGRVHTVGANDWGQLGNGSTSPSPTPVEFDLPDGQYVENTYANFLSIGYNLFAITNEGNVYGAGQNNFGQLGDGTITDRSTPVKFKLPASDDHAIFVAPRGTATFVLTDKGNIYSAGRCVDGSLGDGQSTSSCTNRQTPTKVLLPAGETPTTDIVTDYHTTVVRMKSGKVYGWGLNQFGELGDNTTTSRSTPIQIGNFGNSGQPKAVQVAFDGVTTYVLDDNGVVWNAGYGKYGQLGFMPGSTCTTAAKPCYKQMVPYALNNPPWKSSGATVEQISIDQWTVMFRTSDGNVWGSGWNNAGQLGNGNTSDQTTPVQFDLPTGQQAADIYQTANSSSSGAYNNTFVVTTSGRVYGAGGNSYGQLGNGTTSTHSSHPVRMHVFGPSNKASKVFAGFGTTVVLNKNGTVYTVGNNSDGQLGDGTTTNSSTPKANQYTNIVPVTLY